MDYLPESTRLLYTQLLTECLSGAAPSGRGLSFVTKKIRGGTHWYLQFTVGSRKTQHYVGPDTVETRELIAREKKLWQEAKPDIRQRENLVAMLASGGAYTMSGVEARLFEVLERVGVFAVGGVLVGSHAFALYGNMLGVRWESQTTRTHDVDIAGDYRVLIGVRDREVRLKQALLESELGFIEVPALDRKSPSTTFRIRGKQLSVDILTPMLGRTSSKAVHLGVLDAYAEPVRFLDFVLDDLQPAVILAKAGILINVPAPARYALHKLVISQRRPAAMQTKTKKDIDQADQLLTILFRDRPGDLRLAWTAAMRQPGKFQVQLRAGIKKLSPDNIVRLQGLDKKRVRVARRAKR